MEALNNNRQIAGAKRTLKNLADKYWRVDSKCQTELERKGFVLIDLGTGTNQYICSMDIREITTPDGRKYLAFGICNRGTKTSSGIGVRVYRAFVKEIV